MSNDKVAATFHPARGPIPEVNERQKKRRRQRLKRLRLAGGRR